MLLQDGLLKDQGMDDCSVKESSPYNDILSTMERPPAPPTPHSADSVQTKSFFHSFTRAASTATSKLQRSCSDQTPAQSSSHNNSSNNSNSSFPGLMKIRQSLREKRSVLGSKRQQTVEDVTRELESVKDDLQATQDESTANREVIAILRKQVQTLQREKETLTSIKPDLSEGQLLDILR